jgi:hypothetical protein
MAAHTLPQEVSEHLEAAIQISNRRVHLRFLDEADALIALNLPTAAIVVAGVALESIAADIQELGTSTDRQQIEKWFELRDRAAHACAPAPTLEQAKEMLEGVRRSLTWEIKVGPRLVPVKMPEQSPEQLRGKYRFVPTSSAEFIRGKADELRLEHE